MNPNHSTRYSPSPYHRPAQTHGWAAGSNSPLTPLGHLQAGGLAYEWRRIRINKLISSGLQRADTTASMLAAANSEYLKNSQNAEYAEHPFSVSVDHRVKERKCGFLVRRLSTQHQTIAAYHALNGTTIPGRIARNHTPLERGESLDAVADRAKAFVLSILKEHGKHVKGFGPEDFNLERWNRNDLDEAERVPNPHVAVVSHGGFLGELYEMMYFWNEEERPKRPLRCHWGNAEWTRHVLWIREKEDSSYEFQFRDIRAPRIVDEDTFGTSVLYVKHKFRGTRRNTLCI
ncbi:hypothetical protein BDP27DRAFT_1369256 [Rhodocollybia butyracea]|uniref:Phosphoglycerate mutase-like protein n=1 Tax=Rhodocollybia butyracea TaxID=206335 RepID=A0A9P5U112_9AGAR|nr:hypothetical protein BDP27DRAFT_1369256 [Rhodocollybia butyracea]